MSPPQAALSPVVPFWRDIIGEVKQQKTGGFPDSAASIHLYPMSPPQAALPPVAPFWRYIIGEGV
jgi:hypothetical protein